MGRSKSSCLKIIACGSNSCEKEDELENTERKVSADKRRWSFRKKSNTKQILHKNVTSDAESTGINEYSEPINFDFPKQNKPDLPEKISVIQWPDDASPLTTEASEAVVAEKIPELKSADEVGPIPLPSVEESELASSNKASEFQEADEPTPVSTEVSKPSGTEENFEFQLLDEITPLPSEVTTNTPDRLIETENAVETQDAVETEDPVETEDAIETEPIVSATIDSSTTTMVNFIKVDLNQKEPVAVVLQSAIRGYLAKRTFLKLKNVVKLQAAFRGLLVRRQAVGSLLCVQAIVKMQALVRARHTRLLEGTTIEEKLDEELSQRASVKVDSGTQTENASSQKLLTNVFARQLLESTPKNKQIRIKCDPSKPDSSWKWFDRWTNASSMKHKQTQKPEISSTYTTASEVGSGVPAEVISESVDLSSSYTETTKPVEENLTTSDHEETFDFKASHPTISSDIAEQSQFEVDGLSNENEITSTIAVNQTEMQLDGDSQMMAADSISYEPDPESKQSISSIKNIAPDQPETEDKKIFETRKASNPSYIAAKSRFEDLSLRTISGRLLSQDDGLEMKVDSPVQANILASKELNLPEISVSYYPRLYVGSECGTELSISSTLDSPDRFSIRVEDFDNEINVPEKIDEDLNGDMDIASNLGNVEANAETDSIPVSSFLPAEDSNRESVDSVLAVETAIKDQKLETVEPDVQVQLEAPTDREAHQPSVDITPGNDNAAPKLHITPSSKVSKKLKKNNPDKNGLTHIRKSQSPGKKSRLNGTPDSSARNSTELVVKETKNAKKRISFGSAGPDQVEVEPRDSTSNPLPSYMQATKSAKAKAHLNNSPRSKSDLQEKDINIKKRHSLPANGKQGSPRVQTSISQKQQAANGNLNSP